MYIIKWSNGDVYHQSFKKDKHAAAEHGAGVRCAFRAPHARQGVRIPERGRARAAARRGAQHQQRDPVTNINPLDGRQRRRDY